MPATSIVRCSATALNNFAYRETPVALRNFIRPRSMSSQAHSCERKSEFASLGLTCRRVVHLGSSACIGCIRDTAYQREFCRKPGTMIPMNVMIERSRAWRWTPHFERLNPAPCSATMIAGTRMDRDVDGWSGLITGHAVLPPPTFFTQATSALHPRSARPDDDRTRDQWRTARCRGRT